MMAEVVKAQPCNRALDLADVSPTFIVGAGLPGVLQLGTFRTLDRTRHTTPSSAPTAHWAGRVWFPATFRTRKNIPFRVRLCSTEHLCPFPRSQDYGPAVIVQRNDSFPGV